MSKHTTWHDAGSRIMAGKVNSIKHDITADGVGVMAITYRADKPTAGREAVRLAVAAPDLLAACKAMLAMYRRDRSQIAGTDAVEEQAHAAIARAEGQAPRLSLPKLKSELLKDMDDEDPERFDPL